MNKWKRWLALSTLILLIQIISFPTQAIQLPEDVRYYYQLVPTGANYKEFLLYVERTDPSGIPLHSGSIALTAPATLTFEPAEGWKTAPFSFSSGTTDGVETATDGSYIGFSWYWFGDYTQDVPTSSGDYANRQLLGTITTPVYTLPEDINLLPWPETTTGAHRLAQLSTSADREAQLEIIESFWRMPNTAYPLEGYYQGFYAEDRTDTDTEGQQYAVDLTAGWQGFTIGAYAPEKAATLLLYKYSDQGTPELYAKAETTFGNGTGYFKGKIDFSALALKKPTTLASISLVDGVYDIVILKPSHVECTIKAMAYDESNNIFPGLQGLHVEIPCGDLVVKANSERLNLLRGDGVITLQDRSVLQAAMSGALSSADTEYGYADLNGDGVVTLADLDIIMSPENYNKENITIEVKEVDS